MEPTVALALPLAEVYPSSPVDARHAAFVVRLWPTSWLDLGRLNMGAIAVGFLKEPALLF